MIAADHLRQIAFWSADLTEREFEQARRGIVEKAYGKGAYICHRGDRLDSWSGVTAGLVKLGTVSRNGKAVTLAGLRAGGWFGEGSVLKSEPRQYDLVALRDTRMALMDRNTFLWLFENSVGFNRFLVRQFNERLG
ncbi:MAG: Crp/Fnr family transcriptional regulator, partial [Azorhizobium sp. 35-67-5]